MNNKVVIEPKEKKKKNVPLTAAQLALMPPTPFKEQEAFVRYRNGQKVIGKDGKPIVSGPKKEWDGTKYVVKQRREL